ncbi:MAG: DNA repair protein RadC [Bacteroidaceae bacterium]|nr:DNA repair protein RadC [Bacteroidaceae bacterium]
MNIKELSVEDRPREKLLAKGAAALSEAELLAILIGSGTRDETAVQLMQRMLGDCQGSLRKLERMTYHELTDGRYKGIGEAKAVTLLAALELAKRRSMERAEDKVVLLSAADVFRFMQPKVGNLPHEECHVLPLCADGSLCDNRAVLVGKGGIDGVNVDVRIALREVLLRQATALILTHNHPSGSIRPSRYDDQITEQLQKACKVMNIRMRDHVIVTSDNYYSYAEAGKIG